MNLFFQIAKLQQALPVKIQWQRLNGNFKNEISMKRLQNEYLKKKNYYYHDCDEGVHGKNKIRG